MWELLVHGAKLLNLSLLRLLLERAVLGGRASQTTAQVISFKHKVVRNKRRNAVEVECGALETESIRRVFDELVHYLAVKNVVECIRAWVVEQTAHNLNKRIEMSLN